MNIIFVDSERYLGRLFLIECEKLPGITVGGCFDDSVDALQYAVKHKVEAAFIEVTMPGLTGFGLAGRLRELYPEIVIVFFSEHEEHIPEAFRDWDADYCLLKPYTSSDVTSVLERAELLARRSRKKVTIETFGRFSVYVDGKHINFTSKHAKELMAILVDCRGTSLGTKQFWNIIWEDVEYNHVKAAIIRKALMRLKKILEDAGVEDILVCTNGEYKIDTELVDCDYFRFLKGDKEAINSYYGEYMSDYSWGEETAGFLTRMCPEDHRCHKNR